MKSIFAVVSSNFPELHHTKFFASKEGARKYLKSLADERRHKLGVHCFEETEDKFTYLLGWEEHRSTFSIAEIDLNE